MKVWKTGVHTRAFKPLEEGIDAIRQKSVLPGHLMATRL